MLKKLLVGILVFSLIVPTTASAAYKSYLAYVLGPHQRNNYTGFHAKQTNDQFIVNIVENFSNTSEANFWAQNINRKSISKKYNQKKGSVATIQFNENDKLYRGQDVRMAMENAKWYWFEDAFVAGRVDFR